MRCFYFESVSHRLEDLKSGIVKVRSPFIDYMQLINLLVGLSCS